MIQDATEVRAGRLPRRGLPNLGLGVGLRNQHFSYLMTHDPEVDWFEIISENFIDNYGYVRRVLERVASVRPVVMHGVSLSIGSTDPLDWDYLKKLKALDSDQVFKDPSQFDRLHAQAADAVKRFEFNLRRRMELKGNEVLLSGDGDVPEEFRKLVEQYYKSLSKGSEKK